MSREIDQRDFSENQVTPAREDELRRIASDVSDNVLPGDHRVTVRSFDTTTGNPAAVTSIAAPAEKDKYIERAQAHVQSIGRVLGFAETQPTDFVSDPQVQQASSGAKAVYLQQQYKGIPIFQAAQTVRFDPDGALKESVGSSITVTDDLQVAPQLGVKQAVVEAAEHVAVPDDDEIGQVDAFGEPLPLPSVDLTGFEPNVVAAFPEKPDQPTVLEPGPFGENIKASLIWFPLMANQLRLSWEVVITMPEGQGQYRTLVDADTGEILYCRQLMTMAAGRGNVYRIDGSSDRKVTDFPIALTDYEISIPGDLPPGFPDDWVESGSASGNCVFAHLGDSGPTIQGSLQNGLVVFNPSDPKGDDQKVLNIFYFNCYMHDFFYMLGFREVDGNFQQNNFSRGGMPSDRVDARAYSGTVWGTANMGTPVDGSSPVMKMGLVSSTNRHTAFDSSVVFHEYTHGVTNRLVGGAMNVRALDQPQSGGMGEGWGDYIACSVNDSQTVGSWVKNRPTGIRKFIYDSNFPDNFGNLGQGRYTGVHNIGEVWAATLLEMNRKVGKELGLQLVVDALKLSPANPGFLDMRDAILQALENMRIAGKMSSVEHQSKLRGVWEAFAKFGMGPNAQSNGASLSGVIADFNMPAIPPVVEEEDQEEQIPENFFAWLLAQLRKIFSGG
jgi:extracellular elastinolytic metalloproteinase